MIISEQIIKDFINEEVKKNHSAGFLNMILEDAITVKMSSMLSITKKKKMIKSLHMKK